MRLIYVARTLLPANSRNDKVQYGNVSVDLRKADAMHEVLEARIGAEVVEHGPYVGVGEVVFVALIRFFQPRKGLLLVAEFGVDDGYQPGGNIGSTLQLLEGAQGASPVSGKGRHLPDQAEASTSAKSGCLVEFGDGGRELVLLFVSQAKTNVRWIVSWVNVGHFLCMRNRF